METNEISAHQVRLFSYLENLDGWCSVKEAATASGIARRTAAFHLLRFVQLGIADHVELFPAHRYRLSKLAAKRNTAFVTRLKAAREAFQTTLNK